MVGPELSAAPEAVPNPPYHHFALFAEEPHLGQGQKQHIDQKDL